MDTTSINNAQEHEIIKSGQFDRHNTVHLVVPNNIKVIAQSAFAGFPNLESVTFESGSTVEVIEAGAFGSCPRLKSVKLPNTLKKIGDRAFANCEMLGNIIFEKRNQLKYIGENAFYCVGKDTSCKRKPSSIILSNEFTSLGKGAFYQCKVFNTIDFSQVTVLRQIPENAFYGSSVDKVLMPTSGCVSTIGKSAFASSYLSQVVIPASGITTIKEAAFSFTSVKAFDFRGVKDIGDHAFQAIGSGIKKATLPINCKYSSSSFPSGCQIFKEDLPLLEPYDSTSSTTEKVRDNNKPKGLFGLFKK